jgi:uncharacterized protein YggE
MVVCAGIAIPSVVRAEHLADSQKFHRPIPEALTAATNPGKADVSYPVYTAQLFYPPGGNQQTVRIIGKGRATGSADTARVEFKFSPKAPSISPSPGITSQFEIQSTPLSEESLKPIVDALAASGVPKDAIQVKVTQPGRSGIPFPFPSTPTGGAQILVNLDQPTREGVNQVVTVVNQAVSKNEQIDVSQVGVEYPVKDCQPLEQEAYQAAIQDAQTRARAIAEAMGAQLGKIPSVAEPFYNVFLPGCSSGGKLPFGGDSTPYDPDAPAQVEVTKEIFVSFPVK